METAAHPQDREDDLDPEAPVPSRPESEQPEPVVVRDPDAASEDDDEERTPGEYDPADALPAGAPEGLRKAARNEDLDDKTAKTAGEERLAGEQAEAGALEFLLGAQGPISYDVKTALRTPDGPRILTFKIVQMDGARILEIEDENRIGSGPFSKLDETKNDAALVAEATLHLTDPGGTVVEVDSEEFRGRWDDPKIAMEKRFRWQAGLLQGVAERVKEVSGYAPGNVGRAERQERPVRDAVGNS